MQGDLVILAGSGMAALSAMLFHLVSPHQQMGALPLPRSVLALLGGVSLAVGIAMIAAWSGWAVAMFTPLTVLMVVWSILPLAIGWWRHRRKAGA
jgi:hypothetical protein